MVSRKELGQRNKCWHFFFAKKDKEGKQVSAATWKRWSGVLQAVLKERKTPAVFQETKYPNQVDVVWSLRPVLYMNAKRLVTLSQEKDPTFLLHGFPRGGDNPKVDTPAPSASSGAQAASAAPSASAASAAPVESAASLGAAPKKRGRASIKITHRITKKQKPSEVRSVTYGTVLVTTRGCCLLCPMQINVDEQTGEEADPLHVGERSSILAATASHNDPPEVVALKVYINEKEALAHCEDEVKRFAALPPYRFVVGLLDVLMLPRLRQPNELSCSFERFDMILCDFLQ